MDSGQFISYSRKDNGISELVSNVLKENNIKYRIDKEGIDCSSNYKGLIVDAIDVSEAVIFISSKNSNSSINVIRETKNTAYQPRRYFLIDDF